jgi:hypothetical protein
MRLKIINKFWSPWNRIRADTFARIKGEKLAEFDLIRIANDRVICSIFLKLTFHCSKMKTEYWCRSTIVICGADPKGHTDTIDPIFACNIHAGSYYRMDIIHSSHNKLFFETFVSHYGHYARYVLEFIALKTPRTNEDINLSRF